MATWTDIEQRVWTFDDGKLDFDAWLKADPEREKKWFEASIIHKAWKDENPDLDPSAHDGENGRMFMEWYLYANAVLTV